MITRTWKQKNLGEAMFPIAAYPVSWNAPYGGSHPIHNQYAIVDVERSNTLAVVSNRYKVISNKEAYELAELIIKGVFGNYTLKDFVCHNVRVSQSRGSCIIDLIIPNNFAQVFGNENESWTPFLRITNSYNRKSVLRYEIGFCRWICLNGCIFGQKGFTISIRHDDLEYYQRYDDVIEEARRKMGNIDSIWKDIVRRLEALKAIEMSPLMILPLFCKVFGVKIDEKKITPAMTEMLTMRTKQILNAGKEYFNEMGNNAYALFNVFTDYASFPAGVSEGSVTIHNLQHRVGDWVDEFLAAYNQDGFSLSKYIGEDAMDAAFYLEKITK